MGADHRLERHTRPRRTSRRMVKLTVKMTKMSLMRKIKIPIKSSNQAKLHPISKCERSTRHYLGLIREAQNRDLLSRVLLQPRYWRELYSVEPLNYSGLQRTSLNSTGRPETSSERKRPRPEPANSPSEGRDCFKRDRL
ncbi:hypothetical protein J6590_080389 [Homalodisca vitripennis]|nr:hypothetical protein J6590_080389 [Homalodisca vitripennis]